MNRKPELVRITLFFFVFFDGEQKPPCCDALRSLQSHDASALDFSLTLSHTASL